MVNILPNKLRYSISLVIIIISDLKRGNPLAFKIYFLSEEILMEQENSGSNLFKVDFEEKIQSESSDEEITAEVVTKPESTDIFGLEKNWEVNPEEDDIESTFVEQNNV